MAIAQPITPLKLLTYEQYMAEGEINQWYEILDGEQIFMPSPSWPHQRISRNVTQIFSEYEASTGSGLTVSGPMDVLIQQQPLRVRQPDVLFISHARLAQIGGAPPPVPLPIAPELVVEILSPSDTPGVLADKLADYQRIGVRECWLLRPEARTVEVLIITQSHIVTAATYGTGQNAQSVVFPDLIAGVDAMFAA